MTTGGGRDVGEYIVHQAEMVVKKLGIGAEAVKSEKIGDQTFFIIKYPDSRAASMLFGEKLPFSVYMNTADNKPTKLQNAKSDFFKLLMADIITFFESGKINFDTNETLEVMNIREAALKSTQANGEWVALSK